MEEPGGDTGFAGHILEGGLGVALAAEDRGGGADDLAPPTIVVDVHHGDGHGVVRGADRGDFSHAFNLIGNPNVDEAF